MQFTQHEIKSKLLVLISGALPPPMGGVGVYYQTLLNSSLPEKINLRFVQTSSQNRENSSTGKASLTNLVGAIKDCWRFTKAILAYRPQIAHIGTAFGLSFVKHTYCVILARLFGSRVLLHPHCSYAVIYKERSKLWKWYFGQVIKLTNGIVVLSKEWLQLAAIAPGSIISYLPNAIDLKLYKPIAEKNLIRIKNEELIQILYLGFLGKDKGTFDILSAAQIVASKNRKVVFNLVGAELSPGELSNLHTCVEKSKLSDCVKIQPPAFGEDKITVLNNADIFIYPSYYEGMPMAVIEAMACGLPIIASRIGGLPEMVFEGVNGFLIEQGKPEQLADAVGRLINDREKCISMGKASHQIACEKFDIEQHVTRLIDIYNKVLSEKSTTSIPNNANL